MARQSDAAKFKTSRASLVQAYRLMAAAMVTVESRDRLLRMADKLQQELDAEALEPEVAKRGSNPITNTGKNHVR